MDIFRGWWRGITSEGVLLSSLYCCIPNYEIAHLSLAINIHALYYFPLHRFLGAMFNSRPSWRQRRRLSAARFAITSMLSHWDQATVSQFMLLLSLPPSPDMWLYLHTEYSGHLWFNELFFGYLVYNQGPRKALGYYLLGRSCLFLDPIKNHHSLASDCYDKGYGALSETT